MAYDDNAKKLAVKVIGTVESNLNYSAINFNDPITVGVAQWFGTRAARILNRMRNENAGEWYGVEGSIANQLATIDQNNSWWNSRYLSQAEGDSLRGVLSRNQALQNDQLTQDLEIYKDVAISYNWDPDAHTDTTIYFFSMHHQGPQYALEVVLTLDTECTLEQMHAACLAHPVLGQYGGRYRTTYDLITVADLSGVDPTPVDPGPDPTPTNSNARHIQQQGDLLLVTFDNAETITFYPNGTGLFTPRKGKLPDPVPDPVQPPPPPNTGNWYHPAPGTNITSPYGPRGFDGFHWGVDLSSTTAPTGVPIIAVTDLIVTVAFNAYSGGNATAGGYLKGHTTDGAYTFSYNHMAPGSVGPNAGDTISAGSQIGIEGQTGNVTGTHLHLECYEGAINDPWAPPYGNPIDPLPVLRAHGVGI
jgi:murein DD-endopeptidase MepM/ murein hydrolase activator NlpD